MNAISLLILLNSCHLTSRSKCEKSEWCSYSQGTRKAEWEEQREREREPQRGGGMEEYERNPKIRFLQIFRYTQRRERDMSFLCNKWLIPLSSSLFPSKVSFLRFYFHISSFLRYFFLSCLSLFQSFFWWPIKASGGRNTRSSMTGKTREYTILSRNYFSFFFESISCLDYVTNFKCLLLLSWSILERTFLHQFSSFSYCKGVTVFLTLASHLCPRLIHSKRPASRCDCHSFFFFIFLLFSLFLFRRGIETLLFLLPLTRRGKNKEWEKESTTCIIISKTKCIIIIFLLLRGNSRQLFSPSLTSWYLFFPSSLPSLCKREGKVFVSENSSQEVEREEPMDRYCNIS